MVLIEPPQAAADFRYGILFLRLQGTVLQQDFQMLPQIMQIRLAFQQGNALLRQCNGFFRPIPFEADLRQTICYLGIQPDGIPVIRKHIQMLQEDFIGGFCRFQCSHILCHPGMHHSDLQFRHGQIAAVHLPHGDSGL